jgi:hypothetical protein
MYCIWQEQQLKNELKDLDLPFDIVLSLPSITDYENTVRLNIGDQYEKLIEDNQVVSDLVLIRDRRIKRPHIYSGYSDISVFLTVEKVYIPSGEPKNRKQRKSVKRFTESYDRKEPYDKEYHDLLLQRVRENYIDKGIYFLSNNVSEWMAENYRDNYEQLIKAYINYNCYSSIDYCEGQRIVDEKFNQQNDKDGSLIMGGNWYDERYGSYLGVNKAGLYPKTFKDENKSFATVGFRYVVRIIPN